jgi:LysM repeat protein
MSKSTLLRVALVLMLAGLLASNGLSVLFQAERVYAQFFTPTPPYTPKPSDTPQPSDTPETPQPSDTPETPQPSATPRPPKSGTPKPKSPPVSGDPYHEVWGGYFAYVVKPAGLSLGEAPGFDAPHIRMIEKNSSLCVIGGPERVNGLWWWKFRTAEGLEGWGMSDAVNGTDEICLVTPAPTETPTPTPTRKPIARNVAVPTAVSAALVATPMPMVAPNDLGVHIVNQGETLFCIGRTYGVTPWAIARRNNLHLGSFMFAGQRLIIPAEKWDNIPPGVACPRQFGATSAAATPEPGPTPTPAAAPEQIACRVVHKVAYGETLWSIAQQYRVSPWTVASLSRLANPGRIFVGDELCIP